MLLETLKKILAAVGVYLCIFGLLKAAIHTNYAIQEKKWQTYGRGNVRDGPAVFPAVSAGSCCGRLSDGKIRTETVPVLWRLCQNPEAQGRQVLRGLLQLWGQRWCRLGERLARYTLCCTGTGRKALE